MANNRMWLVHKGLKVGVSLGKADGYHEWWIPEYRNTTENLNKLYEYVQEASWRGDIDFKQHDDFMLLMEDNSLSGLPNNWRYKLIDDEGLMGFEYELGSL